MTYLSTRMSHCIDNLAHFALAAFQMLPIDNENGSICHHLRGHPAQCLRSNGVMFQSEATTVGFIRAAVANDFSVHFHTIGDRAVRTAVDAIAAVTTGTPATNRHSIAHAQLVTPEDVARIAALKIPVAFTYAWAVRDYGYDVTVIDPRPAFAAAARFPGQAILEDYPDEIMPGLGLDARTAVVTLTHDPKIDDPAIREALGSEVFYLGCLGSKRTHAKRVERLAAAGYSDDAIARIHAPVGLAIGARSPAEIAISVLAEITRVLRQGA